jgi:macrolide transport system ATP-binding/permease protein
MAVILSCNRIVKEFGGITVLKNVSFEIMEGDRVGLVGINGAGKSTMANIIYGGLVPEDGQVLWYKNNIEIGYLHQGSRYSQIRVTKDKRSEEIEDGYNEIKEGFKEDFYQISSELGMKKVNTWEEERLSNLSGGEKMKIALANIWSLNPDFLILDEPTNHLDYIGVQWLVEELRKYKGTILIISHDRYFLDKTVNKIIEIKEGSSDTYYGNYSFYREEKLRRYENQLNQYKLQETTKEKINEEISRLKNWSDKGHRDSKKKERAGIGKKEYFRVKAKKKDKQVKSKIKKLEKIQVSGVEKPKEDKKIDFEFKESKSKGTRIVEGNNMRKSYGDRTLFQDSSFYVKRGEKVGIFGENGCGKSTLLRILLGEEPLDGGEIFISSSVTKGYLSQEVLDPNMDVKVIDLFDIISREEGGKIRTLLDNMGFDEKMINKPLKALSHGELTRIRMTKLIIKNQELLILDEPLNHLDVYSREKLEEALLHYNGTILVVSHDRHMLENLCDVLLVFKDNKIIRVNETAREYLENMDSERSNEHKKNSESKKDKEKIDARKNEEEKLIVENRIAFVLGEISKYSPGSKEYEELDVEFKELIKRRKNINAV